MGWTKLTRSWNCITGVELIEPDIWVDDKNNEIDCIGLDDVTIGMCKNKPNRMDCIELDDMKMEWNVLYWIGLDWIG